jgi:hypothetical protein
MGVDNIGGLQGSRTLLDLLKREVHLPLCQQPETGGRDDFILYIVNSKGP